MIGAKLQTAFRKNSKGARGEIALFRAFISASTVENRLNPPKAARGNRQQTAKCCHPDVSTNLRTIHIVYKYWRDILVGGGLCGRRFGDIEPTDSRLLEQGGSTPPSPTQ